MMFLVLNRVKFNDVLNSQTIKIPCKWKFPTLICPCKVENHVFGTHTIERSEISVENRKAKTFFSPEIKFILQ